MPAGRKRIARVARSLAHFDEFGGVSKNIVRESESVMREAPIGALILAATDAGGELEFPFRGKTVRVSVAEVPDPTA